MHLLHTYARSRAQPPGPPGDHPGLSPLYGRGGNAAYSGQASTTRWQEKPEGPGWIPTGRPFLLQRTRGRSKSLFECYIEAAAEEVHSKIAEPNALYTHVLSLIASGFAGTRGELTSFMNRSFYVHEHRQGRLMQKSVDAALKFLVASEMILEIGDHLGSTEFGTLVSRLYIDPRSAALIVSNLRKRTDYTDIGLLHLSAARRICPASMSGTRTGPHWTGCSKRVGPISGSRCRTRRRIWSCIYRALKTAMLLGDWTDEMPDAKICERYSVGPGDIYGMVESINWLLHATQEALPACLRRDSTWRSVSSRPA